MSHIIELPEVLANQITTCPALKGNAIDGLWITVRLIVLRRFKSLIIMQWNCPRWGEWPCVVMRPIDKKIKPLFGSDAWFRGEALPSITSWLFDYRCSHGTRCGFRRPPATSPGDPSLCGGLFPTPARLNIWLARSCLISLSAIKLF